MKKQVILLVLGLAVLVGCTSPKKEQSTLSKEDQALTWQQSSKKNFGNYALDNQTEQEASQVFKERFEMPLETANYTKAKAVIQKVLGVTGNAPEAAVFTINSSGKELYVSASFPYKNAETGDYVYGIIEEKYVYNADDQIRKLANQGIRLFNYKEVSQPTMLPLEESISELAKWGEISDVQTFLDKQKEQLAKPATEHVNQSIEFVQTMGKAEKDKQIGKSLGIKYGTTGNLSELYVYLNDFS